MAINLKDEVKLFMVFDILGDIERSGPKQWCVDRKRLEDVKDHILDLILIFRVIEKYLPDYLDKDKILDYIICHDLPEAITGDITKFQGVPQEEIDRVTKIAIDYLVEKFNKVMDIRTILGNYEGRVDIESKVVSLMDKVHSATTFLKYESEKHIDIDNEGIIPTLSEYVEMAREKNIDIGDIFYQYHGTRLTFSDEECEKYNVPREDANTIVEVIQTFLDEFYQQKLDGTLLDVSNHFPKEATIYKQRY